MASESILPEPTRDDELEATAKWVLFGNDAAPPVWSHHPLRGIMDRIKQALIAEYRKGKFTLPPDTASAPVEAPHRTT
jgi:hypothetical protein